MPGVELDSGFSPVPIPDGSGSSTPSTARAATFGATSLGSFLTRGNVSESSLEDFIEACEQDSSVVGVFSDPRIVPITVCPGSPPLGTHLDVEAKLGISSLWSRGMDGTGVRVVIVDSGVNLEHLNAVGKHPSFDSSLSWGPISSQPLGAMPVGHGTMCAYDVCIAAPRCTLVDHALLTSPAGRFSFDGLLSDAVRSYAVLLSHMASSPSPFAGDLPIRSLVVNNSWGMFHESWDFPVGSPQNYSDNPLHPFNIVVANLEAAGADILFAAGNCGTACPDRRCGGVTDAGIFGANSHESVLCVGGVDTEDELAGYSTEGPGRLADQKPDITAYTHFAGSGVYPADGGTSAATPVAAGVLAAVRRMYPPNVISPAELRRLVRETASGSSFNYQYGHGIIDPEELVDAIEDSISPRASSDRSKRKVPKKRTATAVKKKAKRKSSAKKKSKKKKTKRKQGKKAG